MMRTTSGRPNTAKKMLSPKGTLTSPKKVKTKTQGQDLDVNQLCEAIEQTVSKQKQCETKGKYVEAEAFKRKAKALKQELEDRQMQEYRLKHDKELKQLEEAHMAQMNLFNLDWQKRIEEFNLEIEHLLDELRIKHQKQLHDLENQADSQKKFHESPKLLELRKVEQELGKQENYIEAHRVQLKANKLQKQEQERHLKNRSSKKRQQLHILKGKHESELQAMKMRIQMQVEERERQRMREEDILRQKYENILKETEFEQNQELINLNKRVKLNQLHKKSKVGMFSISKQ